MGFIEEANSRTSVVSDTIFFIVIVAAIVGGVVYYHVAKDNALEGFSQADELFAAGKYEEALAKYVELQDAGWKSDSLDSILYERQAKIEGWKELTAEVMQSADSLLRAGDTAAAVARLGELPNRAFLDDMQRALVASLLPEPAADSASAESTAAPADTAVKP